MHHDHKNVILFFMTNTMRKILDSRVRDFFILNLSFCRDAGSVLLLKDLARFTFRLINHVSLHVTENTIYLILFIYR